MKYFLLFFFSTFALAKNPALKNFREAYRSLAVSTQITPDENLAKIYDLFKETLPKTGKVSEYSGPMQLAAIQLSGAFCEKRIALDSTLSPEKRFLHKSINFTQSPKALTQSHKESLIDEYADAFWQRPTTIEEEKILLEGIGTLANLGGDTELDMKVFLTLFCTVFGTSTDFLTI